jgi:hypothetical protein
MPSSPGLWPTLWTNCQEGFFIDTGASFPLVPFKSTLNNPRGQRLAGPDSQSISCWSERKTDLIFKGRRVTWILLAGSRSVSHHQR